MPRHARLVIPHCPHHIIQRGHNRQDVFTQQEDYAYYLDSLQTWKAHFGVKVYAYCLMSNHVHLLLDPGAAPEALGQMMKRIAARQTRYFNRLHGRSGTLWESRYKSSPVETEMYLLACSRYIELNPVRAHMVARPEDYPWSSYGDKIGTRHTSWLDLDPCHQGLASDVKERARRYQEFVMSAIPDDEWGLIRQAVQRGQLTGTERFIEEVATVMGKRVVLRGQGRPKKQTPL